MCHRHPGYRQLFKCIEPGFAPARLPVVGGRGMVAKTRLPVTAPSERFSTDWDLDEQGSAER